KCVPSGAWQQQIAGSIISRWQDVISRHKDNHPITESEWALLTDKDKTRYEQGQWQFIYGTTLIAIVRTRTAFLGIQIGDGRCVTIGSDSQCRQPIPWDKDCFLNHTTSLCDSSAIRKFRFVFKTRNLPVAAFIGTDGVDDSLGTDERLEDFYLRIWGLLQTDKKNAVHIIHDFLPDMSAKGSRDDISIAGICYENS
ncbi:MAG: protein phosphatase 2C domain-containing protein, partial [Paludibacteraceae bacterium]|nr:protein phosphatase 2C domain-containing protein [Paludibacteraceae bacterium]